MQYYFYKGVRNYFTAANDTVSHLYKPLQTIRIIRNVFKQIKKYMPPFLRLRM